MTYGTNMKINATVHLAGTVVNVQGRLIQRCLICGQKLLDTDEQGIVKVSTRGDDPTVSSWPVGGLIVVSERHAYCSEITETPLIEETIKGLCIDLVE